MQGPPASHNRNLALDGVRGLAALSVALGHCVLMVAGLEVWSATIADLPAMSSVQIVERSLLLLFPSNAAVMVFFVLSGHVLWGSFSRKQMTISDLPDYACARIFRLLPLIVVTTAAIALFQKPSAAETLANMLLLSTSLNGVTWSLQVEMIGSALIFAVWLFARDAPLKLGVALGVVGAIVPFSRGTPLVYMPAFLLGAFIHHVPARVWASRALLWLGVAVLLLPSIYLGYHGITRVFEILAATLVIGCVGKQHLALLGSRVVHLLGAVSYPFYLVHPLAVAIMLTLIGDGLAIGPLSRILVYAVLSVGLSIPLAWALHVAVEMPALRHRLRFARVGNPSRESSRRSG